VLQEAMLRDAKADGGHLASDRGGRLIERDRYPPGRRRFDRQLVLASVDVLDEGVAGDDDPGVAVVLEAARRAQPRFQPAVVGLDVVVGIPVAAVPGGGEQLVEHDRVRRGPVGDDLDRPGSGRGDGTGEEPSGRGGVATWGDEYVDDLAVLVDRAVDIAPLPGDLTYVSSTCQRVPTEWRQGRVASASSGVKRCTHR
jgi:hypothetical protein